MIFSIWSIVPDTYDKVSSADTLWALQKPLCVFNRFPQLHNHVSTPRGRRDTNDVSDPTDGQLASLPALTLRGMRRGYAPACIQLQWRAPMLTGGGWRYSKIKIARFPARSIYRIKKGWYGMAGRQVEDVLTTSGTNVLTGTRGYAIKGGVGGREQSFARKTQPVSKSQCVYLSCYGRTCFTLSWLYVMRF